MSTYFRDWEIFLENPDPTHQYTFNFFGSLKYAPSQITKYYVLNYAQTSILAQFSSYVGSGQFNNEDRLMSITHHTASQTPPSCSTSLERILCSKGRSKRDVDCGSDAVFRAHGATP